MPFMTSTTTTVILKPHECGTCGAVYGISETYEKARRNDHKSWNCPNGHWSHYPQKNTEETLREDLKWERDRAARLTAERDQMEASRRAWKGQATKARNRALAGECPLCGKHVYQLERHVARQHPGESSEHPEPSAE